MSRLRDAAIPEVIRWARARRAGSAAARSTTCHHHQDRRTFDATFGQTQGREPPYANIRPQPNQRFFDAPVSTSRNGRLVARLVVHSRSESGLSEELGSRGVNRPRKTRSRRPRVPSRTTLRLRCWHGPLRGTTNSSGHRGICEVARRPGLAVSCPTTRCIADVHQPNAFGSYRCGVVARRAGHVNPNPGLRTRLGRAQGGPGHAPSDHVHAHPRIAALPCPGWMGRRVARLVRCWLNIRLI